MPCLPPARRFVGYEASRTIPNIVVDGSPNDATVLTLTHWPGQTQPPDTEVDLSAEMAFAFLDDPEGASPDAASEVEAVTNNHFDQDGAAGLLALIDPPAAQELRPLLIDLAAAGDFGTYRHRNAARASMILNAFADPARSPIADQLRGDQSADTATLYDNVLPRLAAIVSDPTPYTDLYAAEDAALTASEEAVATGRVAHQRGSRPRPGHRHRRGGRAQPHRPSVRARPAGARPPHGRPQRHRAGPHPHHPRQPVPLPRPL